ncbi:MAG TPA: flavodoxin family protein [Syntrophales bacterium]|nr:flavodoxin family protein [Syntrophales bacterium]
MNVVILNGSPQKKGTVATLLRAVEEGVSEKHKVDWINVYDLKMKPCIACMKCRPDKTCALPNDDAHSVGQKIKKADGLIIGTPTHWGNMSAQLKTLLDRNVPVFLGEQGGVPFPRQKGKPAIIVAACSTPWPFNLLSAGIRGAARAVWSILRYGGYRLLGQVVKPNTRRNPYMPESLLEKAKKLGRRF